MGWGLTCVESGVRAKARVRARVRARVGKADKGWGCESGIGMMP